MVSNSKLQVLGGDDVLARFRTLRSRQPVKYWAFYSSQLGGIVTDPALMVIPFDDHMVHRGHGIFDTAGTGRRQDLRSGGASRSLSAVRRTIEAAPPRLTRRRCATSSSRRLRSSGQRDGSIRYWLSSGPGSLELSPAAGADPGFFVMVFAGPRRTRSGGTPKGLRVMTTTYPIKAPLYAITKATNYLPNVLMQMEAKEAGFDNGVFIDADGHVGESSNMNVAFVTSDGVLAHPKFDHILSGCTSLRLLELAGGLREQGIIKGVEVRDIPVAEARASREMLLLGSSVKVAPIVQWDGQAIGDGRPGPVAKALLHLLEEDMRKSDRLDRRTLLRRHLQL